jgi:hypothetical protein
MAPFVAQTFCAVYHLSRRHRFGRIYDIISPYLLALYKNMRRIGGKQAPYIDPGPSAPQSGDHSVGSRFDSGEGK